MTECKLCLNPGVCKLDSVITAVPGDDFRIRITIESKCPNVNKIKDSLPDIDPYAEITKGFADSEIYRWAAGLPHLACPVPCAIVKCMEAAADLGLKRDVEMKIE